MEGFKFFPKRIVIDATESDAKKFIKENIDDFLDFIMKSKDYAVADYIDKKESEFSDFILSGGAME